MGKFLIRCTYFIVLITVLILLWAFIKAKEVNFNNFPGNNVSNSSCLRAKLDHVVSNNYLEQCTFLISGSSMSLNNVSGQAIEKRTSENVYNISSFGTRPVHTLGLFDNNAVGNNVRYLLIAFNNCDFGDVNNISVDYTATSSFINGGIFTRRWIFLKTFNLKTFFSDLDDRSKFSSILNTYKSLNFDKYGSVLLERNGFEINDERWRQYTDTTGFGIFCEDIFQLAAICKKSNIDFYLVYLPYRFDLLTENFRSQNMAVSSFLEKELRSNFIDLHNIDLGSNNYCDYAHFFKEGADYITNLILDSLIVQDNQFTQKPDTVYTGIK